MLALYMAANLLSSARALINYTSAHHNIVTIIPILPITLPPVVCEGLALFILLAFMGFLLAALYVCFRVWMHRRVQHDSKDPKTWPILGSQLEAMRNYERLIDWITGFFGDDHRTVKMSFLTRRSYLTVDPANVEHILKTNFQNYPKGQESHNRLFDLLGNGILNTDGAMWKVHRKLGNLEFSIKKLKKLSSTVYITNALRLVEVLAMSNQGVDVQELLLDMTFNSTCEMVFGSEIMEAISICQDPSIANTLDNAQEMITRRYVFPWWRLQRFLNIGSEKVLQQDIKRFNKFLTHVIKHRMSRMQAEANVTLADTAGSLKTTLDIGNVEDAAEDLLSRFILYVQKQASTDLECKKNLKDIKEDEEAEKLMEEVREAIMSFVMAGRDTTASTLSWFLYCMCTNPHAQGEVFQELIKLEKNFHLSKNSSSCECIKDAESDTRDMNEGESRCIIEKRAHDMKEFAEKVLSYEALQSSSTPYLHAALAETLRLYPAVPRDGKVALRDDVLPDGTHLKAGDQVAYIPYSMGRMPFLWGTDALLFNPDRWLVNETFQPQSPFKFTAFQAGPRMCLGKDAAYLQMKITAAMLLRFFHFELVPNHQVQYRMMMVMTMKHGLRVNVTPRC